jgi:hypothetical protein
MKKKLPTIISFVGMYSLILFGAINFYNKFKRIEPIIPTTESRTIVPIPVLIIFSVFVFIIILSLGAQILVAMWTYMKDHKTIIVYPFLVIALGFLQLAVSIMLVVKSMIETNAQKFIQNLGDYIIATESLMNWVIWGVIIGAVGLGLQVYINKTQT